MLKLFTVCSFILFQFIYSLPSLFFQVIYNVFTLVVAIHLHYVHFGCSNLFTVCSLWFYKLFTLCSFLLLQFINSIFILVVQFTYRLSMLVVPNYLKFVILFIPTYIQCVHSGCTNLFMNCNFPFLDTICLVKSLQLTKIIWLKSLI